MTSPSDVLQMVKDNDVKFVDYRLTDTRGREQHVSVPAHQLTEETFEDGQPFDGSSMAGWRGIEASDMILMPDPNTAHMDPFREQNTLILTCDVAEPDTGKGYARDPRSLAKRAEAYLSPPGSVIRLSSVRNLNSSFSTASPGAPTRITRSLRSARKKPPGPRRSNLKAATSATALPLRAATSRFRRLIPSPTSVPKW